ncbi:MAG: hypothetical protein LBK58_07305 [Prevotellaceae bacterium]|nr:hypothetical protein [Prevotellaceae bacterium]
MAGVVRLIMGVRIIWQPKVLAEDSKLSSNTACIAVRPAMTDCKLRLAEGVLKLCAYKPVKGNFFYSLKFFRVTPQNNILPYFFTSATSKFIYTFAKIYLQHSLSILQEK